MENRIYNRDFEQFLKQNADQYRMYPSEKVWKGIYHNLHTRRRWMWFGISLLGLSIATVTWLMLITPASKPQAILSGAIQSGSGPSAATEKTRQAAIKETERMAPSLNYSGNAAPEMPFLINYAQADVPKIMAPGMSETVVPAEAAVQQDMIVSNKTAASEAPVIIKEKTALPEPAGNSSFLLTDPAGDSQSDYLIQPSNHTNISLITPEKNEQEVYPQTIESVLNYYRSSVNRKLTLQVYVVPTVSYRKLRENKSIKEAAAATNTLLNMAVISDINSVVTHKPDVGLELGIAAKYPLLKNLKLRAGLQFNISKYDIKAFHSNGEVTAIALNRGSQVDAIYTWSNYRNYNGFSPNWLKNYYFSVSAPIGAELKIAGNKKANYGVAGTIQPTYVIQDRAYLISADYKNYAQVPWLIRRWNANASLETFVSYSSGKIKWQIGPQVRYQLFSSFTSKYPVNENLFDFGLKVGVSLKD